jgi:adenine-specific DNA methylase
LAKWAINGRRDARVLDPTAGEGVFLEAAARRLRDLGSPIGHLDKQVVGVDLHAGSLAATSRLLEAEGLDARLITADFFSLSAPDDLFSTVGAFDAVIGNPPFVRYQQHIGEVRRLSARAALRQGVRLSGLASSWAALVVHAGAFLKPDGRLAMVLPAELLTVQYAEPVRRWLKEKFEAVRLVRFETLQFPDALENVVLVLANGFGGTDGFTLYNVYDAAGLEAAGFNELPYTPSDDGKWTDILLPAHQRQLFKRLVKERAVPLGHYGAAELGSVTGANSFFALTESTRLEFKLAENQVARISPPGTKHLRGLTFTSADWEALRRGDEAVWMLRPPADDRTKALRRYLAVGLENGVDLAYKCTVRTPWWRPPLVSAPDLFFTYMSHRYPRLIANKARVSFLNSMHGVRLRPTAPRCSREALPLLVLNSLTMVGAEIYGRSYGGGILKMEPSEATSLPMPSPADLEAAWALLKGDRDSLDRDLRSGVWTPVVARVDDVLLRQVMKLPIAEADELRDAALFLRSSRMSRAN